MIFILILIAFIPKLQQKTFRVKKTDCKAIAELKTTKNNESVFSLKSSEMKKEELSSIIEDLKKQNMGVGPWIIEYADNDKILFYNYSHLLAYSNEDNSKGIYNAIDLKKLDVGSYQGSSVVCFNPSPNGEYCIIGNSNSDNYTKNVYLYNIKSNKNHIIEKSNLSNILQAWSNSSEFYVIANINENKIQIIDVRNIETIKTTTIPFNKGKMKKIFVSDGGKILVDAGDKYILENNKWYTPIKLNIEGDILGFKPLLGSEKFSILYYKCGTIYESDLEHNKELYNLGNDVILDKATTSYSIFKTAKNLKVYDFQTNSVYQYAFSNPDPLVKPSPNYHYVMDLNSNPPQIYDSKEKVPLAVLNSFNQGSDFHWLDKNSLVTILFNDNNYEDMKLGKFRIVRINASTGKDEILFDTTK